MGTFDAVGVSQAADFKIALVSLILTYLIVYPLWIAYRRYRFQKRISQGVVTSIYKLGVPLTPAELAYTFSARVKVRHLYATLLDLANRSVIVITKNHSGMQVDLGPKLGDILHPYEKLLVGQVHLAGRPIADHRVVEGFTNYVLSNGEKIRGSREYVFWWLLRNTMRTEGRVRHNMTPRYMKLLLEVGVLTSLPIIVLPLMTLRILQAINSGEIVVVNLVDSFVHGLLFWLIALAPMVIVSFFLLRYKGLMLGRQWMLQPKFHKYLEQIDSYRAFVRLTHSGKLRFESDELKQQAILQTRPYAIALGYVPWGSK